MNVLISLRQPFVGFVATSLTISISASCHAPHAPHAHYFLIISRSYSWISLGSASILKSFATAAAAAAPHICVCPVLTTNPQQNEQPHPPLWLYHPPLPTPLWQTTQRRQLTTTDVALDSGNVQRATTNDSCCRCCYNTTTTAKGVGSIRRRDTL